MASTTNKPPMPARTAPNKSMNRENERRRKEGHRASGRGVEAERDALLAVGRHSQHQRPRRGLRRPDEQAEQQPADPEGDRPGQRHQGQRRRRSSTTSEPTMTGLDPNRSSTSPPSNAPMAAITLALTPNNSTSALEMPYDADAEYRAEREDARQPVPEHRAGEQVVDDVAVPAPFADDLGPQLRGRRRGSRRPSAGPRARASGGAPTMNTGRANSANQAAANSMAARTFWPSATGTPSSPRVSPSPDDEAEVHEEQQHDTAEIAHAPAESGYPAGCLRGGELPQHGVVGHGGQVAARGRARRAAPDLATDSGSRRGSGSSPRSAAPPAAVSAASTRRRRQGASTQIPVTGASKATTRPDSASARNSQLCGVVALGQVVADGAGQVDREHERHDDRVHARRTDVPQRPGQHSATAQRCPGGRGCVHGRPRYSPAHASTRSQPGCPRGGHRRFAEHRRSAGHRARRARASPDRHGAPRGRAEDAGRPAHRRVRSRRRGAPGGPRRSRPNARNWPTSWPGATSRSCAPTRAPRHSARSPGWIPADEKAQVQLNVLGVHDLVLAVLPGMVERKAGGILISGSAAGNSPIPNNATYAATKAFVNTFSESLRGELKRGRRACHGAGPGPGARNVARRA